MPVQGRGVLKPPVMLFLDLVVFYLVLLGCADAVEQTYSACFAPELPQVAAQHASNCTPLTMAGRAPPCNDQGPCSMPCTACETNQHASSTHTLPMALATAVWSHSQRPCVGAFQLRVSCSLLHPFQCSGAHRSTSRHHGPSQCDRAASTAALIQIKCPYSEG